jgi:hypothetical protein
MSRAILSRQYWIELARGNSGDSRMTFPIKQLAVPGQWQGILAKKHTDRAKVDFYQV